MKTLFILSFLILSPFGTLTKTPNNVIQYKPIYTPPPLSKTLINIVEQSETFYSTPYLCPAKKRTIGYGFRLSKKDTISYMSQQTAKKILSEKLLYIKKDIEQKYPILNENQTEALTSLIYNIGMGKFNESKLRKELEMGNIKGVKKIHFSSFRKANGKILRGLEIRRRKEWELWER
jgi:lysozyme